MEQESSLALDAVDRSRVRDCLTFCMPHPG